MSDPHPELVAWEEPGAISRRVLAPIGSAIQLDDGRRLGLRTTTALGRAFNAADRRHIAPTLPEGVRLMESRTDFDPQADGPWRGSQLYRLDYHSSPTVYVIVAVRDIDPDDGPLHFLGKAASQRVAEAIGYGRRGVPYRLTDEVVYEHVDPAEVHTFAAKAGTVLFIESSACMHFGSRKPAKPRYQFQYSFTSPVRNDFMELWRPRRIYPSRPDDSQLRRIVLNTYPV